jgi:PhnB protein
MASRLNPYLTFDGNARQAMEFYRDVFGGDLQFMTFGEYGQTGDAADKVMHAKLETPNGYTLMASDTAPGAHQLMAGNNITVSLSGDDKDDLHRFWDKLSKKGNVTMPMEKQAWGDEFGMCTDQFGVAWMVDIPTG